MIHPSPTVTGTPTTTDLSSCDAKPIQIPGTIQPHGILLALSNPSLLIEQIAGDTLSLLGVTQDHLFGQPVEVLLGPVQAERLRDTLQAQQSATRPLPVFSLIMPKDGRAFDAIAHESEGIVILELEPALKRRNSDTVSTLRMMQSHLENVGSVACLCQAAATAVRAATGFQRVMVYRFLPDCGGVVEAEQRDDAAASFLGLTFPAADIPRQARALYLKNKLRLIPDATYTPSPLTPLINPTTGRQLDMSHSTLRGVSPIHLEYLANMGVRASMSISILRKGQLWGLIVCHHATSHHVPIKMRVACEIFTEMVSLRIDPEITAQELQGRLTAKHVLEELMLGLAHHRDLASGMTQHRPNLLDLVQSGAVSLWFNGRATSMGATPTPEQIERLVAWLETQKQPVFATDELPALYPPAAEFADVASGVLSLSL